MASNEGRNPWREWDPRLGGLYSSGERVPPGAYREVESGREVRLESNDILPACLDGRAGRYSRVVWVYVFAAHGPGRSSTEGK